jgi:hypothetical protein
VNSGAVTREANRRAGRRAQRSTSPLAVGHPAIVILFTAAFAVPLALSTPAALGGLPRMPVIAENGFGDRQNSYAWSMAWFNGALYVGTARSALCVERATIEFYFPWGPYYSTQPTQGVTCPPRISEADLRAEIWRYTPRSRRWTMVYRSPTIPNPQAPGRRIARDIGYRGMVVVRRPNGRSALLVGGLTADEFVPELARRYPPRLLYTTDGSHFHAVRGGPGVIHTTYGPQRPIGYRALTVFDGTLYATVSAGLTGDGVVLRVTDLGGASPRFTQVSPGRLTVFELQTFDGRLYAGTGDAQSGYGVWKTDGGRSLTWTPVVTGGAGRGTAVTSVVSMQTYRNQLYVGASGWATSLFPASELIRIRADGSWDVVVGSPRTVDGTVKTPVSHLGDGFGNPFNIHFWRMAVFRGALLLGTNDWSWSLNGTSLADRQLRSEFGFDLYGTCDGSDWWRATGNGFGRPYDFGVRTMVASPDGLFLGTTNLVQGATIRRSQAQPCGRAASRTADATLERRLRSRHVRRVPRRPAVASEFDTGLSALTRSDLQRLHLRPR